MSSGKSMSVPRGWATTKLGEIAEPRTGKTDPQSTPDSRFIGMEQIDPQTMRLNGTVPCSTMRSSANSFLPGDVLYGRLRPYLNKVYQPDFPGLCSGELIVLSESPAVLGRFLKYRLNAGDFVRFASSLNTGDRPRVDFDQIKIFETLLPPREEQERIADSLDELFSELDAGIASLSRVRTKLTQYSASVLKAAVQGALTAAWREQHPNTEPASELLGRILAERRSRWEQEQLRMFEERGVEPPRNWKTKYREPEGPNTANLAPLPEGWKWATIYQCGNVQLGRQRAPQHHTGDHMRPYLRVANVFEDRVDIRDVKRMNFTPEEFKTYELRYGDILLNEGQSPELVGRPAMYRDEIPGCCYQKTLLRFRAYPGVLERYALCVFRAYLHNGRFRKSASITTSIAHLAAERFILIEFPLPPIAEQEAIVDAVEDHLSVIDSLGTDFTTKLEKSQALRHAILQHAFTGQLVSQNPNDEPASELLKHMAAKREMRAAKVAARRHGRQATQVGGDRKAHFTENGTNRDY
jgi:type I restriction enzyme, S subunit